MADLVIELKKQHAAIREALVQGNDAPDAAAFDRVLVKLRSVVLEHFKAKEHFYSTTAQLCTANNDVVGGTLVRLFESNMRIQSGSIQQLLSSRSDAEATRATLQPRFQNIAKLLQDQMKTDESAVFGIYARHQLPAKAAAPTLSR